MSQPHLACLSLAAFTMLGANLFWAARRAIRRLDSR